MESVAEDKKLKARLMDIYQTLENIYYPMGVTIGTYDTPVNFNESLRTPIHRWYGYKEGFSPSFVNGFVSKHSKSSEDIIFDPFGGVGTTGLEANKMGHHAYLMDVNPLGTFASSVKTKHYSDIEVEYVINEINFLKSIEKWPITVSIDNKTMHYKNVVKVEYWIGSKTINFVATPFHTSFWERVKDAFIGDLDS